MPAISIIVPIYNMECLMRRCVDSLLAQTFKDFELLLVDDGSTDGSPAICDEYVLKDKRVRTFHKPNGGLSDARNYGLARAKGTYSIFADPDDWVEPEGLDLLYEKAVETDADVVMCDLYREDEYVCHLLKQEPSGLNHEAVLKDLFERLNGFTVNKLIRTEVYRRHNILYPQGIYGCEDLYTMTNLFMHDVYIAYVPIAYYHYVYNSNSLSRFYDENTYQMDLKIMEMFDKLLEGHPGCVIAHRNRYDAIITRSFWNGRNYYTSQLFEQRFRHFGRYVFSIREMLFVRVAMYFSCLGYYKQSRVIIEWMFILKRKLKKFINKKR